MIEPKNVDSIEALTAASQEGLCRLALGGLSLVSGGACEHKNSFASQTVPTKEGRRQAQREPPPSMVPDESSFAWGH